MRDKMHIWQRYQKKEMERKMMYQRQQICLGLHLAPIIVFLIILIFYLVFKGAGQ